MMELVKINPKDYGLEENKAKEIAAMFNPMISKMEELEGEFNTVVKSEITPETCRRAKEVRLKYVKVRTGVDGIHKELKRFYLLGGRFVDGWKNAHLMASQGKEEKLKAIEEHYERIEAEKIAKLQEKRSAELEKYEVDFIPDNLGTMIDQVWENYLNGVRLSYEAKKEAERKAEEDRIAKEKAEAEERERVRKENERLKKEAEEREKQVKAEAAKRQKEEEARLKKEAVERKAREEKERKEREAHEAALRKEREERAKVQAKLKARLEAEEKAKMEEAERVQAQLNKGDSAKVQDLLNDLAELKTKYEFKSAKNQKMYQHVAVLIDKVLTHIKSF